MNSTVPIESRLAEDLVYANDIINIRSLLYENPRDRAEVLYMRYLKLKDRIAMQRNIIASDAPYDQNKAKWKGRIQATETIFEEIKKLMNIEDNNETAQTAT